MIHRSTGGSARFHGFAYPDFIASTPSSGSAIPREAAAWLPSNRNRKDGLAGRILDVHCRPKRDRRSACPNFVNQPLGTLESIGVARQSGALRIINLPIRTPNNEKIKRHFVDYSSLPFTWRFTEAASAAIFRQVPHNRAHKLDVPTG